MNHKRVRDLNKDSLIFREGGLLYFGKGAQKKAEEKGAVDKGTCITILFELPV